MGVYFYIKIFLRKGPKNHFEIIKQSKGFSLIVNYIEKTNKNLK